MSGLGGIDSFGVSRYFFHVSWKIIFERLEAKVLLFQVELLKLFFWSLAYILSLRLCFLVIVS